MMERPSEVLSVCDGTNGSEVTLLLIKEKKQREARHAGCHWGNFPRKLYFTCPRKPPARLLQNHWEKGSNPRETHVQ